MHGAGEFHHMCNASMPDKNWQPDTLHLPLRANLRHRRVVGDNTNNGGLTTCYLLATYYLLLTPYLLLTTLLNTCLPLNPKNLLL
jgi:hypothetical protein